MNKENTALKNNTKLKVKKILKQGNKSLFTQYLKVNSYNPLTFLIAFTSAFLHSFMRSNISARWASGGMEADFALAGVAFLFWLSFTLNVQRMVYGTRIDQIIFLISATIGTVVGVIVFN
jgi:hypothetical protein